MTYTVLIEVLKIAVNNSYGSEAGMSAGVIAAYNKHKDIYNEKHKDNSNEKEICKAIDWAYINKKGENINRYIKDFPLDAKEFIIHFLEVLEENDLCINLDLLKLYLKGYFIGEYDNDEIRTLLAEIKEDGSDLALKIDRRIQITDN
ncbi:MAG: hypothetical protein IKL69_04485 [Paludibacteraceae bacterium]|nr:hypothetical protein [Paludibacteraceae bacterium]